jgi:hypothetical protein
MGETSHTNFVNSLKKKLNILICPEFSRPTGSIARHTTSCVDNFFSHCGNIYAAYAID